MASKYTVDVSFTPICTACGAELDCVLTESKVLPGGDPFERDNPYERKDRRVLVRACEKCFVFRGDLPASAQETKV